MVALETPLVFSKYCVTVVWLAVWRPVRDLFRTILRSHPVRIFTYHRVTDLCRDGMSITPDGFDAQLRFIQRHHEVVDFDTAMSLIVRGARLDRPVATIDENQLRSGLRFWDHGLTGAYLWSRGVDPLCIQWLLTKYDRPLLRKLGAWSGMYPPLPDDHGQVENLFAFSSARGKGIATQFAHAMFDVARDRGLAVLVTNIHEVNEPAHAWAARTGWRKFGVVTRYHIDAPFLRNGSVYVHTVTSALPKPRRVPFTLPWAKLTTAAAAIAAGIKKFSRFGESI